MTKKYWIVGAIVIVIIAIVLVVFFLWYRGGLSTFSFSGTATSTLPEASATSTAGYLSYSNQQYDFSLLYPPELQVKEYDDGSSLTVAFQDPTTNEGFQVFVVPYTDSQISQARFEEDEPSGVLDSPTNIVIAGTNAVMFYSTNATMGDTREVWFIQNGFLYEVTTYKELDTWLAGIMATWKFI